MEEYEYVSTLGEGAYGYVWKCQERSTGRVVAIKGFKQAHEEPEIMKLAIREVRVLQALDHPAIIQLIEAFKSKSGRVYMVFPYIGRSAYQELDLQPSGLNAPQLKLLVWQLLQALVYLHRRRVVHRDIKPANILLADSGVIKLCDFGFARPTRCGPRDAQRLSSYVVTRWYRAPEVLVSDAYGPAADVWSVGCTVAELATGQPLFPGKSTPDQLWRIMRCFGPLAAPQAERMAADSRLEGLRVPPRGRSLRERLRGCDPGLFRLIEACLQPDPRLRPTAADLLQMPYFWSVPRLIAGTPLDEVYAKLLCQQQPAPQQQSYRRLPEVDASSTAAMAADASVAADAAAAAVVVPPSVMAPKPARLALDTSARGARGEGAYVGGVDSGGGGGRAGAGPAASTPPAVPATPDMAASEHRAALPAIEFEGSGSGSREGSESGSAAATEASSASGAGSPVGSERGAAERPLGATGCPSSPSVSSTADADAASSRGMSSSACSLTGLDQRGGELGGGGEGDADADAAAADVGAVVGPDAEEYVAVAAAAEDEGYGMVGLHEEEVAVLAASLQAPLLNSCRSIEAEEAEESLQLQRQLLQQRQQSIDAEERQQQQQRQGQQLGGKSSSEAAMPPLLLLLQHQQQQQQGQQEHGVNAARAAPSEGGNTGVTTAAAASSSTASAAPFGSYIIGRDPSRVLDFATAATSGPQQQPTLARASPLGAANAAEPCATMAPVLRPGCLSPVQVSVELADDDTSATALVCAGASCTDAEANAPPLTAQATSQQQQQQDSLPQKGNGAGTVVTNGEAVSLSWQGIVEGRVAQGGVTSAGGDKPPASTRPSDREGSAVVFPTVFVTALSAPPPATFNGSPFPVGSAAVGGGGATAAAPATAGECSAAAATPSPSGVSWRGPTPFSGAPSSPSPLLAEAFSAPTADTSTARLLGSTAMSAALTSGALGRCDTAKFEQCPSAPSAALARLRCGPPAPAPGRTYGCGVGDGGSGGGIPYDPQTSSMVSPNSSYYLSMAASGGGMDGSMNPMPALGECSTPTGAPMAPVVPSQVGPPPHVRRFAAVRGSSGGTPAGMVMLGPGLSPSLSGDFDEENAFASAAGAATAMAASADGASRQQQHTTIRGQQQQEQQFRSRRSVELHPVSAPRPQLLTSRSARLQQPQLLTPDAAAAAGGGGSSVGGGSMHVRRKPSLLHLHTHTLMGGGRDYGPAAGVPRRLGCSYTGDPTPRMGSLLEGDGGEHAAEDCAEGRGVPLPPHPHSATTPGGADADAVPCMGKVSLSGATDYGAGVEMPMEHRHSSGSAAAAAAAAAIGAVGSPAAGRAGLRSGSRTSLRGGLNVKVAPAPAPVSRNRSRFCSFTTARSVGAYDGESLSPPLEHYQQRYAARREGAYMSPSPPPPPPHSMMTVVGEAQPSPAQTPPKYPLQRSESQKPPRTSSAMLPSAFRSMTSRSLEGSGTAAVATVCVGEEEGGVAASAVALNWSRRSRDASEVYRLTEASLDRSSSTRRRESKSGALSKFVKAVKKAIKGIGGKL
ncbi:hypothetical protein Agub_g6260 [Astrephomene gubernaculifera]|uniref:cyclin-dependent kinase n=1 Tax=Astrephomene gubernaculifera TaxID=47775 RepID=A0AAD3DQV1_9CHLO|nr:hypothetical protein Agub_g6260 [Astrephomene gubernaculifera]